LNADLTPLGRAAFAEFLPGFRLEFAKRVFIFLAALHVRPGLGRRIFLLAKNTVFRAAVPSLFFRSGPLFSTKKKRSRPVGQIDLLPVRRASRPLSECRRAAPPWPFLDRRQRGGWGVLVRAWLVFAVSGGARFVSLPLVVVVRQGGARDRCWGGVVLGN